MQHSLSQKQEGPAGKSNLKKGVKFIKEIWFDKYRLIKSLGHGGSAEVFLAEHISLSALRAVKRIPRTEKMHDFWLREATILKNLSHPLIPIIYDLEQDKSYSYIIMEYLEGVSLKTYRKEHEMTKQQIQKTALQICSIMGYLHGLEPPLLYLDLKPENLMVCTDGCIKMVDFGASLPKAEWKRHRIAAGTRGYAAPELLEGGEVDERSDIYSFGMLLFFLFTGETPGRKKKKIQNIDSLNQVDNDWKDVINQCLKYTPGLRFSSTAVLEERLRAMIKREGSERKKWKEKKNIADNCRILRVAGAAPHSGTTHVCFMLAFSFARRGKKVAYREMREDGVVESMLLWTGAKKGKISMCRGVRLFRGEEEKEKGERFDVEIRDYGWIGEGRAKELVQMQNVILVTGGRCWELRKLEQVLSGFQKYPLLCINFVSGTDFLRFAEIYRRCVCLRIPYQPEFSDDSHGQEKFAQRLWEETGSCLEEV